MPDIVCLGEPLYEFSQQADGNYLPGYGGDTSNCAVAAARQGASVAYITRIGADPFGQRLLELWQAESIDTSAIVVQPGASTGIYFISHGPEGHQFSYRRAGSAASRMTPETLPVRSVEQARVLHVSGISQAISGCAADTVFTAIETARAAGVTVSYDTNLRTQLWPLDRARAIIHEAMSMCDIALPGLDDARLLTRQTDPDKIADFYLRLGAPLVALTMGSDGTLVATIESRQHVPAFAVDAVDATGAGDTFDGAFLAEYLSVNDAAAAARYANAAAAIATQGYGAVAPIPRRNVVERFLAQRG